RVQLVRGATGPDPLVPVAGDTGLAAVEPGIRHLPGPAAQRPRRALVRRAGAAGHVQVWPVDGGGPRPVPAGHGRCQSGTAAPAEHPCRDGAGSVPADARRPGPGPGAGPGHGLAGPQRRLRLPGGHPSHGAGPVPHRRSGRGSRGADLAGPGRRADGSPPGRSDAIYWVESGRTRNARKERIAAMTDPRATERVTRVEPNGPASESRPFDHRKIEQAVRMILEAIGEDPDRAGLRDTPRRVAAAYREMFAGVGRNLEDEINVFFDIGHEEMVIVKD